MSDRSIKLNRFTLISQPQEDGTVRLILPTSEHNNRTLTSFYDDVDAEAAINLGWRIMKHGMEARRVKNEKS